MKSTFFFLVYALSFSALADEKIPVIEMGERGGVPNFIARMEKERKAHVAFLGGSITQNQTGHTAMVPEWLEKTYPEVEFTFTNAGLSSTCSVTGAFRADRDVFSKGPVDLLVVEFAVNDDQDAGHDRKTAIRGLEGIIRQYFEANPTGDVISVQFVNPQMLEKKQAGEAVVSVEAHKAAARNYGLAIVDVGQALADEIAAGTMTWDKDYGGTHPNKLGYRFASDLIIKVIDDTVSGETPQTVTLPDPLDEKSYSGATMVDVQTFNWLGGWKYGQVSKELLPVGQIRADYEVYPAIRSDEPGNYLYYNFSGTMLGAFVLAGPDAGRLEVSIDSGEWMPVDLHHHYSKSLNYPRSVVLVDDLSDAYHQAAIRTAVGDSEEKKTATILHFQVNR